MKKLFIFLIALSSNLTLIAQDFEVPENYTLKKDDDYKKYEEDVINCFDWLMQTAPNTEKDKALLANKFLITWISGSPKVTIELNEKVTTFIKSSPELVIIFMGAWTKYAIEEEDYSNKLQGNITGIEAVIEYYQKHKALLNKDKNIEKYIKMKEKGTLEENIKNSI
ncbi:MAG: hypothetical protein HYR91_14400 [Flavobacteriia bacterium]|nr:hypothetical protein [Flavobacteriia bacterium]